MKVRALTDFEPGVFAGRIVEVTNEKGARLIESGDAETLTATTASQPNLVAKNNTIKEKKKGGKPRHK